MAVPVAGRSQRVDRIHLITGRQQRRHHQAPVHLNPHGDHFPVPGVPGDQRVQLTDARHAVADPALFQHLAVFGHHAHVMMGFRPVDPGEDHPHLLMSVADEPEEATP
jgi:hypothetical protein